MLINEIYDYASERIGDLKVADIQIGLGYTAVLLEDRRCGLAYTLHEEEYESCCVMPEAGKLAGRNISELLPWIKMTDVTACGVGLAAVNAALDPPAEKCPASPHCSAACDRREKTALCPGAEWGIAPPYLACYDPSPKADSPLNHSVPVTS